MTMSFETVIRLSSFVLVLVVMAAGERIAPRRPLQTGRGARWFANLTLVAIDTAACRMLFPVLPAGMALIAAERQWGLFNLIELPFLVEASLTVLILDFAIYLQHVAFHFQPLLWRLHRMHHTDLDLDVTTGNRFHPLEIAISMALKMVVIVMIGAPAVAVVVFEVLLNSCSMFNHANVTLPLGLDRILRIVLVTPDMHRVHHSVIPKETNSNFGFCLPWWDRLGNTYRDQPSAGHEAMIIGLREFRNPLSLKLHHLLIQPFVAPHPEDARNNA